MAPGRAGHTIHFFSTGFNPGISVHQRAGACVLPDRRGVDGSTEFSLHCDGVQLDSLRSSSFHRITSALPSSGATTFRHCNTGWVVRSLECKLDAGYENYCPAGKLARRVARAKSGTDQRFASRPGAER